MAIETAPPVAGEALTQTSIQLEEHDVPVGNGEAKAKSGRARNIKLPLESGMSLSYWLQGVRNSPLIDHRSTGQLPAKADVVVIGSGLTGSLAAFELLKSPNPPKTVLLLEAREFCSGATGRNAGHCKPDIWRGYSKYAESLGSEETLRILANEQKTFEDTVAYVRRNNVDCDLWVGKTLDVFMTEGTKAKAETTFQQIQDAGGDVSSIEVISDPKDAERVSRIKGALGVYAWDAATLYPWKLAAHIIESALELGLNLQTWTPVTAVNSARQSQWEVVTDRGSVIASTVIHATNAYASALLPETHGAVRPVPHMCNKVVPPPSFAGSKVLQNSYGVFFDEGMYTINPRSTSDGITLFGGGAPNQYKLLEYVAQEPARRTDDSLENFEPVTDSVKEFTRDGFGWSTQLRGQKGNIPRYDYSWSGITGRSSDLVPMVGQVPGKDGQWFCGCYQAHGMARIFTAAPALVKLVQGATWEEAGLPPSFKLTTARLDNLRKQYQQEQNDS